MQDSILVTVYIPTVYLHLDVSMTKNLYITEALKLLYKIVKRQVEEGRSIIPFTIMYDTERNIILPLQQTIQQVGIMNGSRIYIL